MKTSKTYKLIMHPTEKATRLWINGKRQLNYGAEAMASTNNIGQHLYIISDDEIKEGDKGWLFEDGRIKSVCRFDCTNGLGGIRPTDKKIVATTDITLGDIFHPDLPQLPESFIQAYIKAYNAGKPITEVDLEVVPGVCVGEPDFVIKTRPDNTVIVHQSKMYSRDEVNKLLQDCAIHFGVLNPSKDDGRILNQINKWIQDNL